MVEHQDIFARDGERVLVLHHGERSLGVLDAEGAFTRIPVPGEGRLDNLALAGDAAIVTGHSRIALEILSVRPADGTATVLHSFIYPYGETDFDSRNTAFYMPGQFGDALFEITRIRPDDVGRIWISDFLSGRLFILQPER